ncbi:bifunctional Delta(1)-pyrroline-2-carboxylate/Delta(1)-piperideine-2-carboxylate reductase [Sabulicella glaciei]|uniref:Ornithine cyclodeaminase family protein n=1 Tax=Sabulicella glaciei TaxID=2984948 RepID=A0ABT3NX57_9PROT|nr:ornithine cyclodeaminase family protein [Roseococcus sp. MDT2-1-1]MCW8086744.1 ornithine cyclodeaminase family protein [Roseococcus sp. MDT2-1-1]
MRQLDKAAVAAALPWPRLVAALRAMFRDGCTAPLRHRHALPEGGTLLLMPALNATHSGVKIVHVAPGNAARGLPAVHAEYLLSDAVTGAPLALLDGGELTDRRTAAASVLAASFLARPDSRRLLVLGAGKVAAALAEAHHDHWTLDEVAIWSRRPEQAAALCDRLRHHGVPARPAATPDPRGFDIISAATLATTPLIHGRDLQPGQHLDLVGAFTRAMREADAEAVQRVLVVADTRAGVLAEGGDVVQAIAEGAVDESHVAAELADLCRGAHPGRTRPEEITLFKSVGWAGEDLAAAVMAVQT